MDAETRAFLESIRGEIRTDIKDTRADVRAVGERVGALAERVAVVEAENGAARHTLVQHDKRIASAERLHERAAGRDEGIVRQRTSWADWARIGATVLALVGAGTAGAVVQTCSSRPAVTAPSVP